MQQIGKTIRKVCAFKLQAFLDLPYRGGWEVLLCAKIDEKLIAFRHDAAITRTKGIFVEGELFGDLKVIEKIDLHFVCI